MSTTRSALRGALAGLRFSASLGSSMIVPDRIVRPEREVCAERSRVKGAQGEGEPRAACGHIAPCGCGAQRDVGCCLLCTFPECVFEPGAYVPRGRPPTTGNGVARSLLALGREKAEVAAATGLNIRTIYRIAAKGEVEPA